MMIQRDLDIVGKPVVRKDAPTKVTGAAIYTADLKMPGMLYGRTLRAKVPHAKLISIDTSEAEKMPGIHAVLTYKDVPGKNRYGLSIADTPVLVDDKVRQVGDPLAFIAGESIEACEEAMEKIKVELEELPGVFSIDEAIAEGAPVVHAEAPGNILQHTTTRKGNIEEGYAKSKYIVEHTYTTQRVDHAYLEPEAALAYIDNYGVLNVKNSTQYVFRDRKQIAPVVNMPINMLHIQQQVMGGGFGGKDDAGAEFGACLLAMKTGRPVKMVWTRKESLTFTTKRHPFKIVAKSGCDENGMMTFVEGDIYSDKGAYCSIGHFITKKVGLHLTGPYYVPVVRCDTYAVYTNNTQCGPYRGFGILQAHFVAEQQMEMLAEKVGMDSWEFRMKNALRHGLSTATGQVFTQGVGYVDTLLAAKKYMDEHDLYEDIIR